MNAPHPQINFLSTPDIDVPRIYLFPHNFPDELHASQVSRFHRESGNLSAQQSYTQLYDAKPFRLTFWIPQHLERFAKKLPGSVAENVEALLRGSTLFPLFETYNNARLNLKSEAIPIAHQIANMPKRIVGESGEIHLCPDCIQSDRDEHGQPYVHRSHQIPGVHACWKHKTRLVSACPNCECPFERKNDFLSAPWGPCYGCGLSLLDADFFASSRDVSDREFGYAVFARSMLMEQSKHLDAKFLAAIYRTKLLALGFTRGTRVDNLGVVAALEEYFGSDLLAQIDTAYRNKKNQHWFNLCSSASVCDVPLPRHLALSYFLFGSASEFWAFSEQLASKVQRSNSTSTICTSSHIGHPTKNIGEEGMVHLPSGAVVGRMPDPENSSVHTRIEAILRKNVDWTERDLWNAYPGLMRDLLRNTEDGLTWLRGLQDSLRASGGKDKIINDANPKDLLWAQSFAKVAIELYASIEKPTKITRNKLLIEAGWKGGMPNSSKFPLARQHLDLLMESDWHFYARRILWAKLRSGEMNSSERGVLGFSGIEHHQGRLVLEFFSSVSPKRHLGVGTIMKILNEHKISKDWEGPAVGSLFHKPGRNSSRGGQVLPQTHATPLQ